MPDTSKCFSLIRGRVMRLTRLDACGAKVLGPDSTVVSDGFIQVAMSPQTDEGTTISVTNAAGNLCIFDQPTTKLTGYSIEVQLCGVNPDLVRLMTGQSVVYDSQATPQGVGFRVNSTLDTSTAGFALEVWTSVPAASCAAGSTSYGYFLLPFAKGGTLGDFTIANDAVNFTLTGAITQNGNAWGSGPYNVVANVSGVAVPLLTALDVNDHLHMQLTTIAPPTTLCGASALGVAATSVAQGAPGVLTPANSYAPGTFATIGAIGKTPTTAWTTGNYMLLRDGTKAYWNSTTWVAGVAP